MSPAASSPVACAAAPGGNAGVSEPAAASAAAHPSPVKSPFPAILGEAIQTEDGEAPKGEKKKPVSGIGPGFVWNPLEVLPATTEPAHGVRPGDSLTPVLGWCRPSDLSAEAPDSSEAQHQQADSISETTPADAPDMPGRASRVVPEQAQGDVLPALNAESSAGVRSGKNNNKVETQALAESISQAARADAPHITGAAPGMAPAQREALMALDAKPSAGVPSEKDTNRIEAQPEGSGLGRKEPGSTSFVPEMIPLELSDTPAVTRQLVESIRLAEAASVPAAAVPSLPQHLTAGRAGSSAGWTSLAFVARLRSMSERFAFSEERGLSGERVAPPGPAASPDDTPLPAESADAGTVDPAIPAVSLQPAAVRHQALPVAQPREDHELRPDPGQPALPVAETGRPPALRSGREIDSGHTGAAEEPRQPAAAPPATASVVRDIRLRVNGGEQRVEIQVTERRGEVQVAVRTPDSRLAGTLRDDLPALSARLEQAGFRAETWHPPASLPEPHLSAARVSAEGSAPDHSRGGQRNGREQQEPPPRRQPAVESGRSPDGFAKGFSKQLSSFR